MEPNAFLKLTCFVNISLKKIKNFQLILMIFVFEKDSDMPSNINVRPSKIVKTVKPKTVHKLTRLLSIPNKNK